VQAASCPVPELMALTQQVQALRQRLTTDTHPTDINAIA
jgi:hypothetical protein